MTETQPHLGRPEALRWLNARLRSRTGRTLMAIDGVDGSGKTAFADDLADLVRESGTKVIRISFDNFLNPREVRHARGRTSPEGFALMGYEIVEGKVDETRIVETRRVNFAPTVLQVAP